MKNVLSAVLSVVFPYMIFISDLETSIKSLLVSLLCGGILLFSFFKARDWKRISRHGKVLSAPTLILILIAALNVAFDLQISVIALWFGYFGFTVLSFIVSETLASR